jgi:hypothetical protein
MANRRLTDEERAKLAPLLKYIRRALVVLADGDPALLFATRRYVYLRLMYDERGKPAERRQLKRAKFAAQGGKCALGGHPMSRVGAELHRLNALEGYTAENTQLVCHRCHRDQQAAASFTDISN